MICSRWYQAPIALPFYAIGFVYGFVRGLVRLANASRVQRRRGVYTHRDE